MNKPITLAKADFETALIELVNNSGLPVCLLRATVADLLRVLEGLEQKQLAEDREAWEKGEGKEDECT